MNLISIRVILLRFRRTVYQSSPAPVLPFALLAFSTGACSRPVIQRHDWPPVSLEPTKPLADRSGLLSDNEKRQVRIILYGHSSGGSAMVQLARELNKQGIPVLLTVQVDSVRRFGVDDRKIPPNVARAANFYQPNGMIHGRAGIRAEDPANTQILGNFRVDYKEHPIHCPEYPWYDRTFAKTHAEIDCHPAVWSRVEALIQQQIALAAVKQE
jgi:hypothetical protein